MPRQDVRSLPPTRQRVLDHVRARPGSSVSDIARAMGVFRAAARFHIGRLVRQGLVREVRTRRHTLVFPATEPDDALYVGRRAALAEPACRAVALIIVDSPGLRIVELAQQSGVSERALYHHVKRLVELDLVTKERTGYFVQLRPTSSLAALLAQDAEPEDLE